jgi:hypothetical protein
MSFIHKFIEDKETPEPITWLFRRFVSEFDEQDSIAWNKQVKQTTDKFHRKTLLKQGRCDFDKPQLNLTSEELIVLYNYYYFPMHFQSTFEIYNKLFEEHEEFENKTFFFHDYGCGTLSSSMAFGACFQKHNLSELENQNEFKYNHIDVLSHLHFYVAESTFGDVRSGELGIIRNAANIQYFNLPNLINGYCLNDISTTITKFLERFLAESFYAEPYQYYFFNTAFCTDSHFYFGNVSDKFYLGNFGYDPIQPFKSFCNSQFKSTNEIVVILNFSYVLASESIEIESINSIINEYTKTGCRLIIVNQNPDLDSLNTKWEVLKNSLTFSNTIKGVQPIKHFGSKSKSRYEVLFIINDITLDENGDYNLFNIEINYVEKILKEKQWVKINEVLKILHRQIHNLSFNYKKYGTNIDNIYALILNCTLYIEYLLNFIDENTDLDFIFFLISGDVVQHNFKHINLLLREKLYQNKSKLSNIYFEDAGFYCLGNTDEYCQKLSNLVYKYGIYHSLNIYQKIDMLVGLDKIDDAKLLLKSHLSKFNQIASEYDNDAYIISRYSYLLK